MTVKEVINRYIAGDLSYGMAIEALNECIDLAVPAHTLLDAIDEEFEVDQG